MKISVTFTDEKFLSLAPAPGKTLANVTEVVLRETAAGQVVEITVPDEAAAGEIRLNTVPPAA